MTGSLIFLAPLAILVGVALFAYAGCGLDEFGTGPASQYGTEIMNEASLVSYWRLDESSGTTANDSKNGHNGSYEGVITLGAPGLIIADPDTAILLDGTTGQVDVGFSGDLNPAAKFSVEAWASLHEAPGTARTVISSIEAGHHGYAIIAGASTWQARVGDGSSWITIDSNVGVQQDSPTHLVLTFNAPTFRLYADASDPPGKVDVPSFGVNGSGPLLIGGAGPDVPAHFHGTIDEVAFYNDELTQTQVSLHFAANGWTSTSEPPDVVTGDATGVTTQQATVHGTVNPHGQATTYWFDYGLALPNYGSTVPAAPASAGSGSTAVDEQEPITGLTPGDTYHYRLVAQSPAGKRPGADRQFTTAAKPTYSELVLAAGPVSYWRLDETSGTTASDRVGANPGTYQGSCTLGEPGALAFDLNPAVRFNGTTAFVQIANSPSLQLAGPLSIEVWVRFRVGGVASLLQAILTKGETAYGIARYLGTNQIVFMTTGLSDPALPSKSIAVFDGMWHHLVAVWDGTQKSLYIDGTLDASVAASGTVSANAVDLTIAQNLDAPGSFWDGWIDEPAVYKVALDAATVANHYDTGRGL